MLHYLQVLIIPSLCILAVTHHVHLTQFLSHPFLHSIFTNLASMTTVYGKITNDTFFFFCQKRKAEQRRVNDLLGIVGFLILLDSKTTNWFTIHFQALIWFFWLPQNHDKKRKFAESKARSNIFMAQAGWAEENRTPPWIKWDTAKSGLVTEWSPSLY